MRLLLDTHLLVWAATEPERVPPGARRLVLDPEAMPLFSAASVWEVAIKFALRKPGFIVDPGAMEERLLGAGYAALPVTVAHAIRVRDLPALHGDPFDRLLIAQAMVEGITLLTVDRTLAAYPGPVRLV